MSDQIRLAAGFISANELLTDDTTLVTNFTRQADQPNAIDWFAVQPEFAIQTQIRRGLEIGTGKRIGKLSGTIELFELTVLMRQFIRDTIMVGRPNAPVTMYIASAEDGFGVYQGELTTSYATDSEISYQRYDDDLNHNVQYAFRRGVLVTSYAEDVLATSPIAYYPLTETTGTTINDSTSNGFDGTYTSVTLDSTASPKDGNAPLWDGTNSYGDIYSSGLASAFDMDEGCILIWAKVSGSGVWSDGISRRMIQMRRDGDNQIYLMRTVANDGFSLNHFVGSTFNSFTHTPITTTGWFSVMISWSLSADSIVYYVDGVQVSTDSGLVATVGSGLSNTGTAIGAFSTVPANVWDGYLSNAIIWDKPADAAMIALGVPS